MNKELSNQVFTVIQQIELQRALQRLREQPSNPWAHYELIKVEKQFNIEKDYAKKVN